MTQLNRIDLAIHIAGLRTLIQNCTSYDERQAERAKLVAGLPFYQQPLDASYWNQTRPRPYLGEEERTRVASLLDAFEKMQQDDPEFCGSEVSELATRVMETGTDYFIPVPR